MHLTKFKTFKKPAVGLILAAAILCYSIFFIILTFWKYNHFYYDNLDLAIFNNVFYNTAHGRFFEASIHPPSYLIDHFSPIILILAPLYALFPGPKILLVIETIFFALCAWPLYLCAKKILGEKKQILALCIALAWLVNPLVHNANFYEVHLIPIALFCLFWTAYWYLAEKKFLFALAAFASLLVREDFALIILFFTLLAFIDKRKLFWKVYPAILAVLYLTLSFVIIAHVSPFGSYKFTLFYSWLGGTNALSIITSFILHPLQVVNHMFTMQNVEFLLGLTFPFFFIVLARDKFLWLLAAPLAQVLLAANGGGALMLFTHYGSFFLVALFLTFAGQLKKIEAGKFPRLLPSIFQKKRLVYTVIFGALIYSSLTYGSIIPAVRAWNTNNQSLAKEEIVASIANDGPVAATYELLTPLSTRQKIYSFHYAYVGTTQYALSPYKLPDDTKYLAIDWQDMIKAQMHFHEHHTWYKYVPMLPANLKDILGSFRLVNFNGSVSLWERKTGYDYTKVLARLSADGKATSLETPEMKSFAQKSTGIEISIALPQSPDTTAEYYIEVTTSRRTFSVPLGYSLYPVSAWDNNTTMQMMFYPKSGEAIKRLTLFEWRHGFLKIGDLKNLATTSDARAVNVLSLENLMNPTSQSDGL